MSQTTLAIPKQQNSFKQVKPKTIVGKGENHYVQQEQQQAQHPRGQGRYEQVQDGSRQRPACTSTILKIAGKILLKLLKIDKLTHIKGYTVRLRHGVSLLSSLVIFFSVWHKFCDVLKPARQGHAQFIQRLGFNVFIGPETANCFTVDAALLPQLISGYATTFHCFPQLIKYDHAHPPLL